MGGFFDSGSGSSAANAVASNLFGEYQRRQQNKFNAAEADKQRRWTEEMYDKNNRWNSPENQRALLAAAGLNPNMIYSQGGQPVGDAAAASGGSAAAAAGYSPGVQAIGLDPVSQGQAKLLNAEAEGQQIKNRNMQQEYDLSFALSASNKRYLDSQSDLSAAERDKIAQDIKESDQRISNMLQDIQESISRVGLNEQLTEKALLENKRYNEIVDAKLDNLDANTKKALADAGLSRAKQKEILTMLPLIAQGQEISNANERLRGTGLSIENGILQVNLDNLPYKLKLENANLNEDLKVKQSEIYHNYYQSLSTLGQISTDLGNAVGSAFGDENPNPVVRQSH